MSFGWITELLEYLRNGRFSFRHVQKEREQRAEAAYQGSIRSSLDVVVTSERVGTSDTFLKGVFDA